MFVPENHPKGAYVSLVESLNSLEGGYISTLYL